MRAIHEIMRTQVIGDRNELNKRLNTVIGSSIQVSYISSSHYCPNDLLSRTGVWNARDSNFKHSSQLIVKSRSAFIAVNLIQRY